MILTFGFEESIMSPHSRAFRRGRRPGRRFASVERILFSLILPLIIMTVGPGDFAFADDSSESANEAVEIDPAVEGSPQSEYSMDTPIGPLVYRTARGLSIGDTGLNVGGFTNLEIDRAHGEPLSVQLDSFNFLVLYEPIEFFRAFAELEIGDIFGYEVNGRTRSDPTFQIERLYAELNLDDPINLRFGKFQTPIGRWNLVPAEPFVWTASDPVILDTAFDEHQTGVALTGSVFPNAGTLEYWIYGQIIDPIDPGDTPPPTNRSVGGRLQFTKSLERWSIGTSFLASVRKGDWSYLGAVDAEVRYGRFEVLAELIYEEGAIPGRDLFGTFAQTRFELHPSLSLIARYEYFTRVRSNDGDVHIGDVGFAWQPRAWLILKATYRFSSRENDDVQRGLSTSISVVF